MSEEYAWIDAATLCVEGRGFTDTKGPFDRLPARAEGVVRPEVWNLSRFSTGVTVRFATDATDLRARWTLGGEVVFLVHSAMLAVYGLDLYAKTSAGDWRWVGVTREIAGQEAESGFLWSATDGSRHEYRIYLPLYSSVEKLELGIPAGATIETVPARTEKPIAYYGTSIIHGAGSSRPGMSIVAQLGRRLDYPVTNVAFSGNALMEPEVADLLAELDPAAYLLDALPNMGAALVEERAEAFIRRLARARPGTPILLIEDRTYPSGWLSRTYAEENRTRREAFRQVYGKLLSAGVGPLHYIEGDGLLGTDGDGTNDGSHANDLGASRMVDKLVPVLQRILFDL